MAKRRRGAVAFAGAAGYVKAVRLQDTDPMQTLNRRALLVSVIAASGARLVPPLLRSNSL